MKSQAEAAQVILKAKSRENEYLASGGNVCPYCDSEDISAGHIQADAGTAWSNVECNSCEETWKDVYKLVEIEGFVFEELNKYK